MRIHSQSGAQSNNGTDVVEPNLVFRKLHCHGLGRVDDRCLRGIVPCEPRSGPDACRRSDRHEVASVALLLHVRYDDIGRVVDRSHVDCEDLVEVLVCDFVGGL